MTDKIETQGVRYLGSKRKILPLIAEIIENLDTEEKTLIDVFTGTTRVAQGFKSLGYTVTTSDLNWASEAYSNAFICNNGDVSHLQKYIDELNEIQPEAGWITNNYCDVNIYVDKKDKETGNVTQEEVNIKVWKPHNGAKADAIRERIETLDVEKWEKMYLIASLIFALDKVDNTVGLQQAYLKGWKSNRVDEPLRLKMLDAPVGPVGQHIVGDALKIEYPDAEVAYLDPPYTAADYSTYYHIWDSITAWDKPELSLKTNRRKDREKKKSNEQWDKGMVSPWYRANSAFKATCDLVERLPVRYVVFSYSDEGLITLDQMKELGSRYKDIQIYEKEHNRHVMSRIGAGGADAKNAEKRKNIEYVIVIEK